MKKITNFIVDKRNIILPLFIVLAIISVYVSKDVKINRDMSAYLPSDSETRIGMDIMDREFKTEETSILNVMFKDLKKDSIIKIKDELQNIKYVTEVSYDETEDYNKDNNTLYVLTVDGSSDSKHASFVFNKIKEKYEDYEYYTSGEISEENKTVLEPWIIVVSVSICALILILMCSSYIEPFLFLICIGIAVLLNAGTNIIFSSVSNITSSISAILQLALSMDYSIMLINRYRQEKETTPDKINAMKKALLKAFGSISSSSVTTIVGLLALIFMSFTIGKDLGLVLAKGVLLSLICIFACLPALILMCDKLITKTSKKSFNITLNHLGKFSYHMRFTSLAILAIIFIGSFLLKGNLQLLYTDSENDEVGEVFSENNQMAIIYNNDNEQTMTNYCQNIDKIDKVDEVLCYGNTIGKPLTYDTFNAKLQDLGEGTTIDDYLLKILYYNYYNKDTTIKLTFDQFVTFVQNNVLTNDNFKDKLDSDSRANIAKLSHFTNLNNLNEPRTISDIANILDIDEKKVYDLFVYYNSSHVASSLSMNDFVSFMLNDVLTDRTYASNISASTKTNLETLTKFLDQKTITTNMDSETQADLFGIDSNTIQSLYLYYYTLNGVDTRLTINDFTNFILNDVASNTTYASLFTEDTLTNLQTLRSFSTPSFTSKDMTVQELASIFQMEETQIQSILLLSKSLTPTTTMMDISTFIKFVSDPNLTPYLQGQDLSQIIALKIYTNKELNQSSLPKDKLEELFNPLSEDLVDQIYYAMHQPDTTTFTPQEFINNTISILENTPGVISDEDLAKLKIVAYIINDSVNPNPLTASNLATMLNTNVEGISYIYSIYDCPNHDPNALTMTPSSFVTFLLKNKENANIASNLDNESLGKLQLLQSVITSTSENITYTSSSIASLIGLDQETSLSLYALYTSMYGNLTLSPYHLVNFILDHQSDSLLQGKLDDGTLEKLRLINQVMTGVLNDIHYSNTSMASLLSVSSDDTKLLYSLYELKYQNPNMTISLNNFINFLTNDVITNPAYVNNFDDKSIQDINTIKKITDSTIGNQSYTPEELYNIISILTDSTNQNTIELVYIYYGSEYNYDPSWQISIENLINYVNDDILNDTRFNKFIDEDMRNNIKDSQTKIHDAKELLVGPNYSRVIINTSLDPEGDETFGFIEKLHTDLKNNQDIYIIGNSPMAHEISQTFASELDSITIITMLAIFIVVAITFQSLIIPLILVLIIQCAVYMTMGVLSILGGSVYFISLLIVQSILMGATIDYAILYTSYYKEARVNLTVKDAVIDAYNKSIHTILTSSSILIIVTFIVGKYASAIAAKICQTLSLGVLCSTILILLLLPALLALIDKLVIRHNVKE